MELKTVQRTILIRSQFFCHRLSISMSYFVWNRFEIGLKLCFSTHLLSSSYLARSSEFDFDTTYFYNCTVARNKLSPLGLKFDSRCALCI